MNFVDSHSKDSLLSAWSDTFVVGKESVLQAPEDLVGAIGCADTAGAAADERLYGVDGQPGPVGYLRVTQALSNERKHLRLPLGQAFYAAGPITEARFRLTAGSLENLGFSPVVFVEGTNHAGRGPAFG